MRIFAVHLTCLSLLLLPCPACHAKARSFHAKRAADPNAPQASPRIVQGAVHGSLEPDSIYQKRGHSVRMPDDDDQLLSRSAPFDPEQFRDSLLPVSVEMTVEEMEEVLIQHNAMQKKEFSAVLARLDAARSAIKRHLDIHGTALPGEYAKLRTNELMAVVEHNDMAKRHHSERNIMRQELEKFERLRREHFENMLWYLNLKSITFAAGGCAVSVAVIALGCVGLHRMLQGPN